MYGVPRGIVLQLRWRLCVHVVSCWIVLRLSWRLCVHIVPCRVVLRHSWRLLLYRVRCWIILWLHGRLRVHTVSCRIVLWLSWRLLLYGVPRRIVLCLHGRLRVHVVPCRIVLELNRSLFFLHIVSCRILHHGCGLGGCLLTAVQLHFLFQCVVCCPGRNSSFFVIRIVPDLVHAGPRRLDASCGQCSQPKRNQSIPLGHPCHGSRRRQFLRDIAIHRRALFVFGAGVGWSWTLQTKQLQPTRSRAVRRTGRRFHLHGMPRWIILRLHRRVRVHIVSCRIVLRLSWRLRVHIMSCRIVLCLHLYRGLLLYCMSCRIVLQLHRRVRVHIVSCRIVLRRNWGLLL